MESGATKQCMSWVVSKRLSGSLVALGIFLAVARTQAAGAAGPIQSTEPALPVEAGLAEVIALALHNNPSTRAAWSRAEAADAAVTVAQAAYWPIVQARFEGGSDQWYTPAATGIDHFRRIQATTVLALQYVLLDFGRRSAEVRGSMAALEVAGFTWNRTIQETVFAVQAAWYAHDAACARETAADALLEATRIALETARLAKESGLADTPDVLRAKKAVFLAESESQDAKSAREITRAEVLVAAGFPANAQLRFTRETSSPDVSAMTFQIDELIEEALSMRPDLRAQAAAVERAAAATQRARADFYPEIRIEGSYANSSLAYHARTGKASGTFQDNLNGYGAFLVGSWDLFDGFSRVAKVRERKAGEAVAAEELRLAGLAVTGEVWGAYYEYLAAAERLRAASAWLASSAEDARAAEAAWQTGLENLSALAEIRALFATARYEEAEAVADYATATARLAFSIGRLPADS